MRRRVLKMPVRAREGVRWALAGPEASLHRDDLDLVKGIRAGAVRRIIPGQ
jgi:hypothetical protein